MAATETLIVSKINYFDLDKLIALLVLARAISDKEQTNVDILNPYPEWGEQAANIAEVKGSFVTKVELPQNQVKIENLSAEVDAIEWKVEGNNLLLNLVSHSGKSIEAQQLRLTNPTLPYKQVITLGIDDTQQLAKLVSDTALSVRVSLHTHEPAAKVGDSSFVYTDSNVLCDLVYKYLTANGYEISPNLATALLAGIYWRTNSLQNYFTNQALLDTAKQLLKAGGRLSSVVSKIFATLNPTAKQLWQEALENVETMGASGIAFSVINRETAFDYSKVSHVSPVYNPLYYLQGITASFLFLPMADKYTEVICSSVDRDVNLRKIFKDYKLRGDSLQAQVSFNLGLSDTKELVWKLFNTGTEMPASQVPAEPAVIHAEPVPMAMAEVAPIEQDEPEVTLAPEPVAEQEISGSYQPELEAEIAPVPEISSVLENPTTADAVQAELHQPETQNEEDSSWVDLSV